MEPYNKKKLFSISEVTPGNYRNKKFEPKDLKHLQFWGDTIIYEENEEIKEGDNKKGIFSLNELNYLLKKETLIQSDLKNIPDFSLPYAKKELLIRLDKSYAKIDLENQKILWNLSINKFGKNFDFCAQSESLAYTLNDQLKIITAKGKKWIFAEKKNKHIIYGQAVHRNEWGIKKGTFWSPNGNYLAFYRMDQSMVSQYKQTDNSKKTAKQKSIFYPNVGEYSHIVNIQILNSQTGKSILLPTGKPTDRFFTNITWSYDSQSIFIAEVSRSQQEMNLMRYFLNGEKQLLFQERSNKYVEPEHGPYFISSQEFVWQSKRTGHNHLYLYKKNGELVRALTNGKYEVLSVAGYNKRTENLIITTNEDSCLERNVFFLNINTLQKERVFAEKGWHKPMTSKNGEEIISRFSNFRHPLSILRWSKNESQTLKRNENPYTEYSMPTVKYGTIIAADNHTTLHYRLTMPCNFNEKKKYPAIVHLYGGPHIQMVQNIWLGGSKGWELYMAQHGFVMFTLDNRGSDNRGVDFEQCIFQNIGKIPTEDQTCGVKFLASLPYVDSNKLGIYGWSFGGFMSLRMSLRTNYFKVSVAGGPVTDWRLYEIMYGERYMQMPQQNPKGYADNDLSRFAGNLTRKLMVIHCELDPVVKIENSYKLLHALKAHNKDVDFIQYQKFPHNVTGPQRARLFKKISDYFIKNL